MKVPMIINNLEALSQELFLIPESVNLIGLTKECHNLPEEDLASMYQKLYRHRIVNIYSLHTPMSMHLLKGCPSREFMSLL